MGHQGNTSNLDCTRKLHVSMANEKEARGDERGRRKERGSERRRKDKRGNKQRRQKGREQVIDGYMHILIGDHQIVNMSDKVLVVMDPRGNEGHHACKLLRNWRNFLRITDFGDKGATWTVQTMQHNKQQDSNSCGILALRMIISGTETLVMSRHRHGLFIRHGCMLLLHCFSVKGMQRTSVWCSPLPKKMQMRA
ncbi:unnamed protein product [Arctogadus glacialis]